MAYFAAADRAVNHLLIWRDRAVLALVPGEFNLF